MKRFIPLSIIAAVLICFGLIAVFQNNDKTNLEEDTNIVEKESSNNENSTPEETIEVDDDTKIMNYVSEENHNIDKLVQETNSDNNKSKLKESFITLTDFIFYDGEIKGVKFKDLTESTKEKILNLWYKLDSKIDEKYPEQKEEIKNSTSRSYNTIKSKAKELKETLVDKYKNKVGEDKYNNQVEKGEEVKGKTKEKATSIKDKISNWYKNLKEGE